MYETFSSWRGFTQNRMLVLIKLYTNTNLCYLFCLNFHSMLYIKIKKKIKKHVCTVTILFSNTGELLSHKHTPPLTHPPLNQSINHLTTWPLTQPTRPPMPIRSHTNSSTSPITHNHPHTMGPPTSVPTFCKNTLNCTML
jgi:hypothetical protein